MFCLIALVIKINYSFSAQTYRKTNI